MYASTLADYSIETYYDADGVERVLSMANGKQVIEYQNEYLNDYLDFEVDLGYFAEEFYWC